jgi:hypothetical protein
MSRDAVSRDIASSLPIEVAVTCSGARKMKPVLVGPVAIEVPAAEEETWTPDPMAVLEVPRVRGGVEVLEALAGKVQPTTPTGASRPVVIGTPAVDEMRVPVAPETKLGDVP